MPSSLAAELSAPPPRFSEQGRRRVALLERDFVVRTQRRELRRACGQRLLSQLPLSQRAHDIWGNCCS